MVQDNRLFVDANFFVALFNPEDFLHKNAMAVAEQIEDGGVQLVISNLIFLEIITVLSMRCGKEPAKEAGKYLLTNPWIKTIHISDKLQKESWEIFQEIGSKNVSFVDASTIAVVQNEEIGQLLTFDQTDFKKLQKIYKFKLWKTT